MEELEVDRVGGRCGVCGVERVGVCVVERVGVCAVLDGVLPFGVRGALRGVVAVEGGGGVRKVGDRAVCNGVCGVERVELSGGL